MVKDAGPRMSGRSGDHRASRVDISHLGRFAPQARPLVVLAGNGTWPGAAVEGLLRARGYSLRSVAEFNEVVNVVNTQHPDLILFGPGLQGGDRFALCRALRERRWLASIPVLFLCLEGRAEELRALEAGAWDAVQCPPDPELFLARVRNAVEIKRKADEVLEVRLVDRLTGCSNRAGLLTRLREEMLLARRYKEPLACLVVAVDPLAEVVCSLADPEASEAAVWRAASILRLGSRRSDTLARLSDLEFAIVAPSTNHVGSRKLVARIAHAFESSSVRVRASGITRPFRPIAGVTARSSWPAEEESPEVLIAEASEALAVAKMRGSGHYIYAPGLDHGASQDLS